MLIIFFVVGSVLIRLIPHIPNFAPITATAIFGGVFLKRRYALMIPLVSMLLSDYLLLYINPFGYPFVDFTKIYPVTAMFHPTIIYVYASFLMSSLIGLGLRKHKNILYVFFGSLLASLQFFIITNYGVWAAGMYSRDVYGLIESYMMGVPFFRYTLVGDLFYTGVLFGAYGLILNITQNLRLILSFRIK